MRIIDGAASELSNKKRNNVGGRKPRFDYSIKNKKTKKCAEARVDRSLASALSVRF